MQVWLITVGEPLPTDNDNVRLYRTGLLARRLTENGHSVLWWTSTVNHVKKERRYKSDTTIRVSDSFKLILLSSLLYKSNVSIRRIINHYGIARKFARYARLERKPDVILCSLPTLELSLAAVRYGKKNNVPVVLDIRDLWPDIFLDLAPEWCRWMARVILTPMFKITSDACAGATAITGITPEFVDWGVRYAGRTRMRLDRDFPLGYSQEAPTREELIRADAFWDEKGVGSRRTEFVICFFGTIGRQFDLETVIEAARKLEQMGHKFRFVLCGSGDNYEHYKTLANDCSSIIFPGWVGAAEIWTLMRKASVGLAPYRSAKDFQDSLPNKIIEYLSAGLPIVSSLKGGVQGLLENHDCGVTYSNGNADELASVLIRLYNNRDLLQRMSENAYALYKDKFVAEKVYSDMISYLESVHKTYCMKDAGERL